MDIGHINFVFSKGSTFLVFFFSSLFGILVFLLTSEVDRKIKARLISTR